MICLTTTQQLNSLIQQSIPSIIIFISPQKLLPEESLLTFLYTYELSKPLHDHIYVWSIIDEEVYEKWAIWDFPKVFVIRNKQVMLQFVGYNRQKATQAISLLYQLLGRGKVAKKLNIQKSVCNKKHKMQFKNQINSVKYINGCFQCSECHMLSHVEADKPVLSCLICDQFFCYECSHENVIL